MSRAMVAGAFAIAALMFVATMSQSARPAFAAFHCMRIHAVMGGFNGNDDVQFVELRMDLGGQTALLNHKLRFLSDAGVQTAEFTFPSGVTHGLEGDSILIATAEYNDDFSPGHDADFEFTLANTTGTSVDNRLHPVQSANGKVIFEPGFQNCTLGSGPPVDSVTYGTTTVAADWGTPPNNKAVALPAPSDNRGLRLNNLNTPPTNNSTEYSLEAVSTTTEFIAGNAATLEADKRFPRNNARVLSAVFAPPGVGGTVVEPKLPEGPALPIREESSGEGLPVTPILAVTAAVLVSAIALGIIELRRRRRA